MKLSWLGHSCFSVESRGFRLITDPYENVRGLRDINTGADAVYCSHGHFDHAYREGVKLRSGGVNPFSITEIKSFHDAAGGSLRGENIIRRFESEGISVVHLGDLGHELDTEDIKPLYGCDVLLIPVGGTYTIDGRTAARVAESINPRLVIPMHYRKGSKGFKELSGAEEFCSCFPAEKVHYSDSSILEPGPGMPEGVLVLKMP